MVIYPEKTESLTLLYMYKHEAVHIKIKMHIRLLSLSGGGFQIHAAMPIIDYPTDYEM